MKGAKSIVFLMLASVSVQAHFEEKNGQLVEKAGIGREYMVSPVVYQMRKNADAISAFESMKNIQECRETAHEIIQNNLTGDLGYFVEKDLTETCMNSFKAYYNLLLLKDAGLIKKKLLEIKQCEKTVQQLLESLNFDFPMKPEFKKNAHNFILKLKKSKLAPSEKADILSEKWVNRISTSDKLHYKLQKYLAKNCKSYQLENSVFKFNMKDFIENAHLLQMSAHKVNQHKDEALRKWVDSFVSEYFETKIDTDLDCILAGSEQIDKRTFFHNLKNRIFENTIYTYTKRNFDNFKDAVGNYDKYL